MHTDSYLILRSAALFCRCISHWGKISLKDCLPIWLSDLSCVWHWVQFLIWDWQSQWAIKSMPDRTVEMLPALSCDWEGRLLSNHAGRSCRGFGSHWVSQDHSLAWKPRANAAFSPSGQQALTGHQRRRAYASGVGAAPQSVFPADHSLLIMQTIQCMHGRVVRHAGVHWECAGQIALLILCIASSQFLWFALLFWSKNSQL